MGFFIQIKSLVWWLMMMKKKKGVWIVDDEKWNLEVCWLFDIVGFVVDWLQKEMCDWGERNRLNQEDWEEERFWRILFYYLYIYIFKDRLNQEKVNCQSKKLKWIQDWGKIRLSPIFIFYYLFIYFCVCTVYILFLSQNELICIIGGVILIGWMKGLGLHFDDC